MPQRFDTARLEAFSDGVFAIAITLLVLEISVPADVFDDLLRGIALVAEAFDSSSAERPAVLFYGATLFVISAAMTAIARYVAGHPGFLLEGVTKAEMDSVTSRSAPNLVFYGAGHRRAAGCGVRVPRDRRGGPDPGRSRRTEPGVRELGGRAHEEA